MSSDEKLLKEPVQVGEPEENHVNAKSDVAMLAEKVETEKRERAEECLRRLNEIWEEYNCIPEIVTVLTSARGAAQVVHQINVRALDWPSETER